METSQQQQQQALTPAQVQSQTQELQKKLNVSSILNGDAVKSRLSEILGKKAAGFASSVISVSKTAALVGADPNSIVGAAIVAATLDLPINPSLGFAYIVPYNSKQGKQAQFQLGWKGTVQLAQRTGQYSTINATDIREGELLGNNILSGDIIVKPLLKDRDKAPIIGYAAYFKLANGFEKTLYMSKEEITAHAMKYSQSFRNDKYKTSLWSTQFDMMAKKTVLKLLISKYGPLSIEMQRAQMYDQAVVTNHETVMNGGYVEEAEFSYIDNPEFSEEATQDEQPSEANKGRAAAIDAASELFSERK